MQSQGNCPLVARHPTEVSANGAADLGVPFYPLIRLEVPTYTPDDLPPALAAIPAIKPGSRAAA